MSKSFFQLKIVVVHKYQTLMYLYLMISFITIYHVLTQHHEAFLYLIAPMYFLLIGLPYRTTNSDNNVGLLDLYGDLSVIYVHLSVHGVDLSEKIITTSTLISCFYNNFHLLVNLIIVNKRSVNMISDKWWQKYATTEYCEHVKLA